MIAVAPGRVNLIGEHTDYNDGYVMPIAIDRAVSVAFTARADRVIRVRSALESGTHDIALDALDSWRGRGWASYVAGVAWAMKKAGLAVPGADLEITSTLPAGAGLSSSAALEIGVYRALAHLAGIDWNPKEAAVTARHAENQFVGVPCGVMDQMASACSEKGKATLIDCRSLDIDHIAIPDSVAVVVIDTGVRRTLATSDYVERRDACERAVNQLRRVYARVRALRDVTVADLNAAIDKLDAIAWQRASHVVAENQRVLEMAQVMMAGNLTRCGELLIESHESLRDLYEVSSPELDTAVDCAMEHSACFGARMTGAGFGGCAVALVRADGVRDFAIETGKKLGVGDVFMVSASDGATVS